MLMLDEIIKNKYKEISQLKSSFDISTAFASWIERRISARTSRDAAVTAVMPY